MFCHIKGILYPIMMRYDHSAEHLNEYQHYHQDLLYYILMHLKHYTVARSFTCFSHNVGLKQGNTLIMLN